MTQGVDLAVTTGESALGEDWARWFVLPPVTLLALHHELLRDRCSDFVRRRGVRAASRAAKRPRNPGTPESTLCSAPRQPPPRAVTGYGSHVNA